LSAHFCNNDKITWILNHSRKNSDFVSSGGHQYKRIKRACILSVHHLCVFVVDVPD
jgi:hypothetical protein